MKDKCTPAKYDMNIKIDTKEQWLDLLYFGGLIGYTYCDGSDISHEDYKDPLMGTIVHVYVDNDNRVVVPGFDGSLSCDDYEAAEDFEVLYNRLESEATDYWREEEEEQYREKMEREMYNRMWEEEFGGR